MSLSSMALRLCTVAAITNRTDALDSVADSQIAPMEMLQDGEHRPVIAVYVDEVTAAGGFVDVGAGEGLTTLSFEIAVVMADQGAGEVFGIPATDAGLEIALDLIEQQIREALNDAENPWAVLWRQMVFKEGGYKLQRGTGKLEDGRRLAARELTLTLGLIADPPIGGPLPPFWTDFKAAVSAYPAFSEIASKVCEAIDGSPLAGWRQLQAAQGMTPNAVRSIGVDPPFETVDEEAPLVAQIAIDGDDQIRIIEA